MAEIVTMPKLGFDMAEGTLVRWLKAEGDPVIKGDLLAEIETDKATVEVEAAFGGVLHKRLVSQGTSVPVGDPIAIIAAPGEEVPPDLVGSPTQATRQPAISHSITPSASPSGTPSTTLPVTDTIIASPLARRIAAESGLDLRQIRGSGPGGRIVKRDVMGAKDQPDVRSEGTAMPRMQLAPRADEVVPTSKLRQAISRRLVESKQMVPHFYVTNSYHMDALMAFRTQYNNILPQEDKLSINDFVVKAVALALREFPNLNASLGDDHIIRHGSVNIGVAVAVEGGLLTVVCRDADLKSIPQISKEVKEKAARARAGKVKPADIEGSTFSISNLGMYDVEHFIAIINPPEAAILAVGSVQESVFSEKGVIKSGMIMKASLSADHRVSDGAEAAQFMQSLAKYLEEPLRLVL